MRFAVLGLLGVVAAASLWLFLAARPVRYAVPEGFAPDVARGRYMATAAGCGSCHASRRDDPVEMGGGEGIVSPFGVIYPSNISSDRVFGIGVWSDQQFLNAVKNGVSPRRAHYYPAFPYARFTGLSNADALDIKAYLLSLPPVAKPARETRLKPPFSIRAGVGAWKAVNFRRGPVRDKAASSSARGEYLVEHAAHCGECHTPRNVALGLDRRRAFAGAKGFDGRVAPPLTPARLRKAGFDAFDTALQYGVRLNGVDSIEAPTMLDVVDNMRALTPEDRRAIYDYLSQRPDR